MMKELRVYYISTLPEKIEDLQRLRDEPQALAELCHQLKGSAGAYGFAKLSDYAKETMERAANEEDHKAALQALVGHLKELLT